MEWISVKDRLPVINTIVSLKKDNEWISRGWLLKSGKFSIKYTPKIQIMDVPTHWMPLPPSPQEIQNQSHQHQNNN